MGQEGTEYSLMKNKQFIGANKLKLMNYEKIYNNLIKKAKTLEEIREKEKKNKIKVFEKHHILPKCLGGENNKSNLVLLLPKEHFICHRLLCKIHPNHRGLRFAMWKLILSNGKGPTVNQQRYIPSARVYESIRIEHISYMSSSQKGKSPVERFGENGKKIKLFSSIDNVMIGNSIYKIWVKKYGKEEADRKMLTYKKNIANSKIGKHSKRIKCKYCGLETIVTNIVRFHNEKCKNKNS